MLPSEFIDRLNLIYGTEAPTIRAQLRPAERVGIWLNPLRGEVGETRAALAALGCDITPCPWHSQAVSIPAAQKSHVTASPLVTSGAIYVQGWSSMLAPLVLAPQPGEAILDLAAAPGGKTLHLAARMQLEGVLSAVEPVRTRFFTLRDNLQRCGAGEFVKTYQVDGREVGRKTPERFDAVLLDSPCTSEARFNVDDPESYSFWGPRKLAEAARKQKALLRSALDATRPGGRVLYCTCAFSPEENELVVAHTLKRLAGKIELEPLELPIESRAGLTAWGGKELPSELSLTRRVVPSGELTGFYLALVRKL
jgi:tRNA (cytosine49-C5)-methyltransferase